MKSIILFLASILISANAFADVLLGFEGEKAASVGIFIKDLRTGRIIAENDADKALVPASVMKTVTAATALTSLGTDFKFYTPIYLYGHHSTADSTLWEGNLVIESCGDPTIDSKVFEGKPSIFAEIISGLNCAGISQITGNIIINETLAQAGCVPQWEIEDVAWDYGAGLYGFNYRDNIFTLWPSTERTRPYVPELDVTVYQDSDGTDLLRGIDSNNLIVYGREPGNANWSLRTSMNNPAQIFTHELKERMLRAGIQVQGHDNSDDSERMLVYMHESPATSDILHCMMVESHNLFAEGMLRALAPIGSRKDAFEKQKSIFRGWGVSPAYCKILDGSGLARGNRLQPIFIANVLEKMAKEKHSSTYCKLFPKVGMEGTVKGLLEKTRLKGQLALKSGSMNGVQCFAGYKIDENNKPTHVVVILVNSFFCPRSQVRAAIEKLLLNTF